MIRTAFSRRSPVVCVLLTAAVGAWLFAGGPVGPAAAAGPSATTSSAEAASAEAMSGAETAIFAGGCFWCVESDFDHVPGVLTTVSGYSGGATDNPTYKQVTYEDTGHREVVQVTFDPKKVSYAALLDIFWHSVDPTDAGGQFCDRGHSYTTAVYATSASQLAVAKASKAALDASGKAGKPIVTEVAPALPFWPAEDYHQDYSQKSPVRYRVYRWNCGRDARVEALWGADAHKGIKK